MTKPKTHRSPDQKAALLREHYVDKKPISAICEAADVQPSLFYYWQKQLFENAPRALDGEKRVSSRERELEAENAKLKAKLAEKEAALTRKDGVIAVISEEYATLKKARGEP